MPEEKRSPRRPILGLLSLSVIVLLTIQICQLNRIADNQARLAGEIESIREELARGVRPPAADPDEVPGAPSPEPGPFRPELGRRGGTLHSYLVADIDSFNAITATTMPSFILLSYVMDSLFLRDPFVREWGPRLAERWEYSPDHKTMTIHLRKGVVWSDGTPFTADDVIFTIEAILDKRVRSYSSMSFYYPVGDREEPIRWRRIDDWTLDLIQPVPSVSLPDRLQFFILPRHRCEAALEAGEFNAFWGVSTPVSEIVGTGPFVIERYIPGSRITVARNPRYWGRDAAGKPLPYVDRIHVHILKDAEAARIRFIGKEIDVLEVAGPDVPSLKAGEGPGAYRIEDIGPTVGFIYLAFNQNNGRNPETGEPWVDPVKARWFRDRTFRQAIAHTVDRRTIIDNVFNGLAVPSYSVYNVSCRRFHNPRVTRYPYDLARARAILDAAGMVDRDGDGVREDRDGHRVSFRFFYDSSSEVERKMAPILADRMKEVGLEPLLRIKDSTAIGRLIFNHFDWDVILNSESGGAGEPIGTDPLWTSGGNYHIWFPSQPVPSTAWEARVDRIFAEATKEFDWQRRRSLLFEFQEVIAREVPLILTVAPKRHVAIRNHVGNLAPEAYELDLLWNAPYVYLEGTGPAER